VGLACRSDAVLAARKALAEAAMMLTTSAELADPAHSVRSALEANGVIKPYRADRRYMESYARDWHDVVDLVCHVQLTLDPAYQEAVDRRLHSRRPPRPLNAPVAKASDLATLLSSHGYRPIVVDITPADVRAAGLVVVRAIVPGLVTTAPAAVPHLGHYRVRTNLPPPLA
jgi:ribosomal protein S12 methylthiotransferase accessory factor